LSLELKKSKLLEDENNKLKKALEFKAEKHIDAVGAEIISFDPSSWRRVVLINAGKNKGIKEGMFAIDHNGYLVGRITLVKNDYSRLMLVDDPEFTLAVFVGNDAMGMLQGGLDSLRILYIDHFDKINLNDIVWFKMPLATYPFYIGRVEKINESKENLFFEVEVRPFSGNTILNKIFIIK
jgi:rod shape-determining protein MreC